MRRHSLQPRGGKARRSTRQATNATDATRRANDEAERSYEDWEKADDAAAKARDEAAKAEREASERARDEAQRVYQDCQKVQQLEEELLLHCGVGRVAMRAPPLGASAPVALWVHRLLACVRRRLPATCAPPAWHVRAGFKNPSLVRAPTVTLGLS